MQRPLFLAIVLLTASLAGCAGGSDDSADANVSPDSLDGGQMATEETANSTDEGHTHSASLDAAPEWSPGTFWEVQVTDGLSDQTHTATRVVAGESGGAYRVGMPADSFSHPVLIGHFPSMGNVQPDTLGFIVHNEPFKPLDFPLEEGKTWSTTLYQAEYEAEIVEAADGIARVAMHSETGRWINLTYDTSMDAISEYTGPLGLTVEVVSHGHGFEGEVKVPYDRGQFIDGRIVGAFDFMLQPAGPTGSLTVDPSYDEASIALIAGSVGLGPVPPPPGVYHEVATDPGGNTFELQTTGGLEAAFASTPEAAGEWSFEHVAAGFGAAATEIIAYKTQTVELPTGGTGG